MIIQKSMQQVKTKVAINLVIDLFLVQIQELLVVVMAVVINILFNLKGYLKKSEIPLVFLKEILKQEETMTLNG
jgi:hypothetical protein